MNQQIPDYSAMYANSACGPCKAYSPITQQMPAPAVVSGNNAPQGITMKGSAGMPVTVAGGAAGQSFSMQQGSVTIPVAGLSAAGLPAAIQQPAIQEAVSSAGQVAIRPTTPATTGQLMPITDTTQVAPMTMESLEFLNGFMRSQIGRRVRVEFLIGTNTFTDKSGMLIGVGANYILLREANSDDLLACDFFNIKFVTFYY